MPAFNEARNLGMVRTAYALAAPQQLSPQIELTMVNDGSQDDAARVMQGLCAAHIQVLYLKLSRNFGKEYALTAGLDAARAEVVVMMDADGQHAISLLPLILQKWRQGVENPGGIVGLAGGLDRTVYKLVNWRSHIEIPANTGGFRPMDCQVANALKALPERNRFMKGLYA